MHEGFYLFAVWSFALLCCTPLLAHPEKTKTRRGDERATKRRVQTLWLLQLSTNHSSPGNTLWIYHLAESSPEFTMPLAAQLRPSFPCSYLHLRQYPSRKTDYFPTLVSPRHHAGVPCSGACQVRSVTSHPTRPGGRLLANVASQGS